LAALPSAASKPAAIAIDPTLAPIRRKFAPVKRTMSLRPPFRRGRPHSRGRSTLLPAERATVAHRPKRRESSAKAAADQWRTYTTDSLSDNRQSRPLTHCGKPPHNGRDPAFHTGARRSILTG